MYTINRLPTLKDQKCQFVNVEINKEPLFMSNITSKTFSNNYMPSWAINLIQLFF